MKGCVFMVWMSLLCLCGDSWKGVLGMMKCLEGVFLEEKKNVVLVI